MSLWSCGDESSCALVGLECLLGAYLRLRKRDTGSLTFGMNEGCRDALSLAESPKEISTTVVVTSSWLSEACDVDLLFTTAMLIKESLAGIRERGSETSQEESG